MEAAQAPPSAYALVQSTIGAQLKWWRGAPADGIGARGAVGWLRSTCSVGYLTAWTGAHPTLCRGDDPLLDASGNAIQ
jgi:hypothetical protein